MALVEWGVLCRACRRGAKRSTRDGFPPGEASLQVSVGVGCGRSDWG